MLEAQIAIDRLSFKKRAHEMRNRPNANSSETAEETITLHYFFEGGDTTSATLFDEHVIYPDPKKDKSIKPIFFNLCTA